jgi:hypothetical protein
MTRPRASGADGHPRRYRARRSAGCSNCSRGGSPRRRRRSRVPGSDRVRNELSGRVPRPADAARLLSGVSTPSPNDLVVKACEVCLRRHPRADGSYADRASSCTNARPPRPTNAVSATAVLVGYRWLRSAAPRGPNVRSDVTRDKRSTEVRSACRDRSGAARPSSWRPQARLPVAAAPVSFRAPRESAEAARRWSGV